MERECCAILLCGFTFILTLHDVVANTGCLVSLLCLPRSKVMFRSGDFFKFSAKEEGKFDVILDYTFLW